MNRTQAQAVRILPFAFLAAVILVLTNAYGTTTPNALAAGEILYGVAPAETSCTLGEYALYSIDTSSGTATAIGCLELDMGSVSAIEMNLTTGILYGTGRVFSVVDQEDQLVLFTIDTTTGAASVVGDTGLPFGGETGGNITDLSFRNSDDVLFAHRKRRDNTGDELYTVNTATGVATLVGTTTLDQRGNSIAHSADGTLYFVGDEGDNVGDIDLFTLNQTNAAPNNELTLDFTAVDDVPSFDDCERPMSAMDFHPGTNVLYGVIGRGQEVGDDSCLLTIDTTTGVVTAIGFTVDHLEAIAFSGGTGGTATPTATATRTSTPAASSTATRTPTPTLTPMPSATFTVPQSQPLGGNIAGAIAGVAEAAAANRAGQPTGVAPASTTGIRPPSTGDAGLLP